MLFCRNLCKRRQIWISELHFGEVRCDTWVGWWLVGKPMVNFLFTLTELSWLSVTGPELWGEMCRARLLSHGVDLYAAKFYLDRIVPSNRSWQQNTRDIGLPEDKECIPLHFLVLARYQSVMNRQTDVQTNRFAVTYTAHAKLDLTRCNTNISSTLLCITSGLQNVLTA